jgi:SAM-dependent methyltransferase
MTAVADLKRADLTEMMQAYKQTSLLRAAVELGVFDALAKAPADAAEVAGRIGTDVRGTRILLDALAAIRLLELEDDSLRLSSVAAKHLVRDRPGYLGGMVHVMSSDWEWDALRDLAAAVRAGGTVMDVHAETPEYEYWEDFASYAATVAEPTANRTADVLEPWAAGRKSLDVLDVACGHGIYGYTIAERFPSAKVWSLDWPNVLPLAEGHARRMGVRDRVGFIPGDMFATPLGGPYDLVLVTNVTHHFSQAKVTELFGRLRGALRPDGRLVIVGFVSGDDPPAIDPAPYLFSVLMLVWTHGGEAHSVATYNSALDAAGFGPASVHRTELPFRILVAERRQGDSG